MPAEVGMVISRKNQQLAVRTGPVPAAQTQHLPECSAHDRHLLIRLETHSLTAVSRFTVGVNEDALI